MNALGDAGQSVLHVPGQEYGRIQREGAFYRNLKEDGVKYQDAKTKARKFHLDKLDQAYNPNRLQHVGAKDAMIDPHVTIRHEIELPKKDPGYVQLLQQDTVNRDATRRVITDYSGTPIIKVDQEGGMFDEVRRSRENEPNKR